MGKSKEQKMYERITSNIQSVGDPKTIEEYLSGNNRYVYFAPSVYEKIMKGLGYPDPISQYIWLAANIVNCDNWTDFHRRFDINTIKDNMEEVLDLPRIQGVYKDILTCLYNLNGEGVKTMRETAELCNRTHSSIRNRKDKALRLLRHPMRLRILYREGYLNPPSIDIRSVKTEPHHFVAMLDKPNAEGVNVVIGVQRPIEQLDEFIDTLGVNDQSDVVCYNIASVQTDIASAINLPASVFAALELSSIDILNSTLYHYTLVIIRTPEENKTTEDYIQELRDIADEELIRFERNFWTRVTNICNSVYMGDDYAWIPEFNQLMAGYTIPSKFQLDASNIIRLVLEDYLDSFSIHCEFNESESGRGLNIQLSEDQE